MCCHTVYPPYKVINHTPMPLEKHMQNISKLFFLSTILLLSKPAQSESMVAYPSAKVSFSDFKSLVATVESHRTERLVSLDTFLEMSQDPDTIILDTRSENRFDRIHVKGAQHLNFSDFNQQSLAELIPNPNTRVLIYCNNNFDGNQVDFTTKIALPPSLDSLDSSGPAGQFKEQERPIMMALNIPTYINLYGYGYQNVYELDELVDVNDSRITFEGSIVSSEPSIRPILPIEPIPQPSSSKKKRRRN